MDALVESASLEIDGPRIESVEGGFAGRFTCMASPCEVLVDTSERGEAADLTQAAAAEARRIERRYSRYRDDNIVHRINHAEGRPISVDEETAKLLDYAEQCYQSSNGKFDITSGVLRRVWRFDGGDRIPSASALSEALVLVGWNKAEWDGATLTLRAGMEIDLGGIGKEYAVDRASAICGARTERAFLINFGGDLFARGPRREGQPWQVGIENPEPVGASARYRLELVHGGLATSGDARRFVRWNGRRLGHILDPTTGWPVLDAPRSVTVLAATCVEAGTLSTLAYLEGGNARDFLETQGVSHWIL